MLNLDFVINVFKFALFFVIFILIAELIFKVILSRNKKDSKKNITILGLFMELDNSSIFAISLSIVRYLLIIFALLILSYYHTYILLILLFLAILYGFTSKSIKNLVIELVSSFAIYFSIVCSKLLVGYLIEVRYEWYVILGYIFLVLFIIIYATYFLLRNVNYVISTSKFVRRIRNEDN